MDSPTCPPVFIRVGRRLRSTARSQLLPIPGDPPSFESACARCRLAVAKSSQQLCIKTSVEGQHLPELLRAADTLQMPAPTLVPLLPNELVCISPAELFMTSPIVCISHL